MFRICEGSGLFNGFRCRVLLPHWQRAVRLETMFPRGDCWGLAGNDVGAIQRGDCRPGHKYRNLGQAVPCLKPFSFSCPGVACPMPTLVTRSLCVRRQGALENLRRDCGKCHSIRSSDQEVQTNCIGYRVQQTHHG